jgi:hypothetical protein
MRRSLEAERSILQANAMIGGDVALRRTRSRNFDERWPVDIRSRSSRAAGPKCGDIRHELTGEGNQRGRRPIGM